MTILGWLLMQDLSLLESDPIPHRAQVLSEAGITTRLPDNTLLNWRCKQPNHYSGVARGQITTHPG